MKLFLSFLFILLSGSMLAQQGLHVGFSMGPAKTIVEKEINAIYPPNSVFKGGVSVGETFYCEYGINDQISFRANLRHNAYRFITSFGNLQGATSTGLLYEDGRTETWGFDYFHYEASMLLRTPLIYKKLNLFLRAGLVYFPTVNATTEQQEGGLYFNNISYLNYHSTIYSLNRKNYGGITAGLGIELKVLKNNYFTFEILDYQGFKPVSYVVGETNLNGQTYTNRMTSNGSYITLQFGFKRFINLKKKKLPIEQIEEDSETLRKENKKKTRFNNSDPDLSKGNKIIGGSYRLIDRQAFYIPPFGISIMPRFLVFIKDRFAIGTTFYFKYLKYASSSNQEMMGGFASRYYLGNSKNKVFGALDIIGGRYKDISTDFITAVVPGIGFDKKVYASISIESSCRYMYLINTNFTNNFFVDLGLNYHF